MNCSNTYVAKSNIKNAGKGLFASKKLQCGQIITDFRLIDSKINTVVIFDGSSTYSYDKSCNAHYANDIVNISSIKNLYSNIINGLPLIEKHNQLNINAEIRTITGKENNKVVLWSSREIDIDEEIYVHYGFQFWISDEKIYSEEKFIDSVFNSGNIPILMFPECFYEMPSAKKSMTEYAKTFYGINSEWKILNGNIIISNKDYVGCNEFTLENLLLINELFLQRNNTYFYMNDPTFVDFLSKRDLENIIDCIVKNFSDICDGSGNLKKFLYLGFDFVIKHNYSLDLFIRVVKNKSCLMNKQIIEQLCTKLLYYNTPIEEEYCNVIFNMINEIGIRNIIKIISNISIPSSSSTGNCHDIFTSYIIANLNDDMLEKEKDMKIYLTMVEILFHRNDIKIRNYHK